MKRIECIIRPNKLVELEEGLNGVVTGMTVTYVKGCGIQKGETQIYRGTPMHINLLPKIKVEVVVEDVQVEEIVALVQKLCRTGKIGDGKIFISTVEEAVRIRTGERGSSALAGTGVECL